MKRFRVPPKSPATVCFVVMIFSAGGFANSTPELSIPQTQLATNGGDNASGARVIRGSSSEASLFRAIADTLHFKATPGEVVITILPDSLRGERVREYINLRVPARSWRTGRAFFWQTGDGDIGVHHIDFHAATDRSTATLTLTVAVQR